MGIRRLRTFHEGRSPRRLITYGFLLLVLLPLSLALNLVARACEVVGELAEELDDRLALLIGPVKGWALSALPTEEGESNPENNKEI